MRNALVVGGTGPTGPFVVNGLLERGYKVAILHRGRHESTLIPDEVEHIHVDPYDADALRAGVGDRRFSVAIASYGRLRAVADALVGRAEHVVALGGTPTYKGWWFPEVNVPWGYPVPVTESFPKATVREEGDRSWKVARAEREFLDHVERGDFQGCILRLPYVYGPGQLVPREWSIMRRILDGRPAILLPEGGLALLSHGYGVNLAHTMLLAADNPSAANGKAYNVGDEQTLSLRQWVEVIATTMGTEIDIVSMPDIPGHPSTAITNHQYAHHRVMDLTNVKRDLGYRDVVPVLEALPVTTRWYLDNPIPRGSELERNLQDPFDYAVEDAVLHRVASMKTDLLTILSGEMVVQARAYESKPLSPDVS
jgi:nucleoside-diphosphate-sugar epimerase